MTYTGHKTSAFHMVWRIPTFENSFRIDRENKKGRFFLISYSKNSEFVIENVMITEQLNSFTK